MNIGIIIGICSVIIAYYISFCILFRTIEIETNERVKYHFFIWLFFIVISSIPILGLGVTISALITLNSCGVAKIKCLFLRKF